MQERQLPPDFVKTFIRYANILRFIGLDVCQEDQKIVFTKCVKFCIFNALFLPMLVGEVMYVTMSNKTGATFLEVANAAPTTLMVLQDAVKMLAILFKRDRIRIVIMTIAEIWSTLIETEKKTEILKIWLRRLKIYDTVFFTCGLIALGVYEMTPLITTVHEINKGSDNVKYLFPMQLYFFYWLNSHFQYAVAYFYVLTTSSVLHMALYVSCDCLLIALTYVLSTLLRLLEEDLEEAVNMYEKNDEESLNKIKAFVATHQKLLWIAEELNNIFGIQIFVHLSFSSIVLCWFGFLTVVGNDMLFRNILAVFFIIIVIWNICWPGQILADTSFGLCEVAYRSIWYVKDVKLRRYIVIIMHRAQKPCYLTSLGFSNLTLANFSKVLSTAWSYLSLINQMYQNLEL